jgi:hypothetical protein
VLTAVDPFRPRFAGICGPPWDHVRRFPPTWIGHVCGGLSSHEGACGRGGQATVDPPLRRLWPASRRVRSSPLSSLELAGSSTRCLCVHGLGWSIAPAFAPEGWALVYVFDTLDGRLLYQDTSGHWSALLRDLRLRRGHRAASGRSAAVQAAAISRLTTVATARRRTDTATV